MSEITKQVEAKIIKQNLALAGSLEQIAEATLEVVREWAKANGKGNRHEPLIVLSDLLRFISTEGK